MEFLRSEINIGLKKPISFLHITDSHLPTENSPTEETRLLREQTEGAIKECLAYADSHGMMPIHTGDVMTFCNETNLKFVDKNFGGRDFIFAAGNHDFCDEGGYGDDPNNFSLNLKKLSSHFPNDLTFSVRVFENGFKVVTLFNGFFRITKEQLDALKRECDGELPVVLCIHVPLFSEEHAKARMSIGNCAHLLCPTEEFLSQYPERFQFHRADSVTEEAARFIRTSPAIKAVIAGHTHMNYEETLESGALQIVTAASRFGYARIITLTS